MNDLAVSGARAEALVVTFVLEAGLPTPVLEAEVRAMADAARRAGVAIVGGDTKVVEHGKADGMYITTAGIGRPLPGVRVDPRSVRPGDRVLVSGCIGDHGVTILLARGDLDLEADLRSDTRSVLPLVEALVEAAGPGVRWMRDPTRGGVATALNELARDCGLSVHLFEAMRARPRRRFAARASCWGSTRCTSPTKDSSWRSSRPSWPMRRSTRCSGRRRRGRARHRRGPRAAGARGARDHPLRRQPHRRHARRRSAAAHLLKAQGDDDGLQPDRARSRTASRRATRCASRSSRAKPTGWPTRAARCPTASCDGGRLLAFGRGSYCTDAQHVSVEFVHPVIVGKRALPALDLSIEFRRWLRRHAPAARTS